MAASGKLIFPLVLLLCTCFIYQVNKNKQKKNTQKKKIHYLFYSVLYVGRHFISASLLLIYFLVCITYCMKMQCPHWCPH